MTPRFAFLGLAVVVSSVVVSGAASPAGPPCPKSCTALVTLFNEPFDDESRVSHFPLGHDANIASRALVNKIIAGTCPFSPKERIIFLIHSPSRTFGGKVPSQSARTDRSSLASGLAATGSGAQC